MVVKLRSRTAVWINSSNLTYSGLVKVVMFTMTIALSPAIAAVTALISNTNGGENRKIIICSTILLNNLI